MIPDYHLHSSFSGDCDEDICKMIEYAKSIGMNSFCITDHYDKGFPIYEEDPCDFNLDIENYKQYMNNIKCKFSKDFDLKIGIEVGITEDNYLDLIKENDRFSDLDFIIASSHVVDNMDPYYPAFFKGKDEKSCYRKYFETILFNVKNYKNYDVYGHLDYILRYGPTKAANFDIKDYMDIFEEAFKIMISDGKGIEINTGSLYRGMEFAHPHISLLKLYKEMGGEILTFGSDCHDTIHIGYAFDKVSSLVKDTGFNYYCTFNERKPSFIKL